MLGVLTYPFYLLSKPVIPKSGCKGTAFFAYMQIKSAEIVKFLHFFLSRMGELEDEGFGLSEAEMIDGRAGAVPYT